MVHGLYCFYEQRIAHHDIKPENIFVSKDDTFKLGFNIYDYLF
jgi:serine/threonine protein kinase